MTTETEGAALAAPQDPIDAVLAEMETQSANVETEAEGNETEATGEDATAATDDQAAKPKKSAKERIDELTAKMREAEREAEYWRSRAVTPPQQQQTQTPAPAAAPEDKEPNPADYTHGELDAAFIRDHALFHANKAFEERLAKMEATRAAQEAQRAVQSKFAEAEAKYPDFREKVVDGGARGLWPCTPDMAAAIQESDVAGDIAYHLATNPAEARRISGLSPHSQAREIGKLEVKFSTPPAAQPKIKTDAPEPPPVLRGQGGRFEAAPDTDDFAAFERLAAKQGF